MDVPNVGARIVGSAGVNIDLQSYLWTSFRGVRQMVVVDVSSLQANSQPKSGGLV